MRQRGFAASLIGASGSEKQRGGRMPSQATSAKVSPVHREYTPLPAFLSYLVPGLGQISQGRIGKGILFFVCVTTLFFYGQYLGNWSNVYLPDTSTEPNTLNLGGLA